MLPCTRTVHTALLSSRDVDKPIVYKPVRAHLNCKEASRSKEAAGGGDDRMNGEHALAFPAVQCKPWLVPAAELAGMSPTRSRACRHESSTVLH